MKKILSVYPVYVALAFFLACVFCSPSWGACRPGSANGTSSSEAFCVYGSADCSGGCTGEGACKTECPSTYSLYGKIYTGVEEINTRCNWNGYGTNMCGKYYGYVKSSLCHYTIQCDNQCDADSVICVNDGKRWQYTGGATCGGMECVEITCDSTFNCIEYPFNRCEDVPSSGEVYCDANGCTGLPYSRWYSEFRQECTNECGEHRTNSITGDTLISFNSSCDDTTQCSEETKCIDFPNTGSYALYKVCITGNEQIGNAVQNRSFPQFVGGGVGNCASLGMPSNNITDPMNNQSNTTFPNQNINDVISDNCLIYGIDCPSNYLDTTNYNDNENRNPEHCICEPLDGSTFVSTIICPDGSRTTFYGSCSLWELANSSSSFSASSSSTNPPESSDSGSENPPTSSGGISGDYPEWNVINQNQKNANEVLGSMVQTLKTLPSSIISGIRELLNGYNYNETDDEFIWDRVDSLVTLDTIIDTAGILHAIFNRLDSNNHIIDTIPSISFNGCPCIYFFRGNTSNTIGTNGHLAFKEIKFDLGDFHGLNLCTIIRTIVVAFASVVSFFIGFAIFKNIAQ